MSVRGDAWFDANLLELLLQGVQGALELVVFVLKGLGVAAGGGATSDAVGRLALGVVLHAGRAAAGAAVAADLANLNGWLLGSRCATRRVVAPTLQRSHAWPVRVEADSFFLTLLLKSSAV